MRVVLSPVRGGPLAGFYSLRYEGNYTLPSLNSVENYVSLARERMGERFKPIVSLVGYDANDTNELEGIVLLLRDHGYVVHALLDGSWLPKWARSANFVSVVLESSEWPVPFPADEVICHVTTLPLPRVMPRSGEVYARAVVSKSAEPSEYFNIISQSPGWRVEGPKMPEVTLSDEE